MVTLVGVCWREHVEGCAATRNRAREAVVDQQAAYAAAVMVRMRRQNMTERCTLAVEGKVNSDWFSSTADN